MKKYSLELLFTGVIFLFLAACHHPAEEKSEKKMVFSKKIILDLSRKYNPIEGFGVNITPAQWRDGNLRPVIDLLVDDLGCTLFRFDCYGKADWLDPGKQNPDKTFPEEYLESVYTGRIFTDAWEAFRYLNTKGIEPIFNISGRIPAEWAGPDGEHLVDFESYAEMAVSMLSWARKRENLKFSLFMPYNETNLGFPEGPYMDPEDCVPSAVEIINRLDREAMEDISLIVMGDSHIKPANIEAFLKEPGLADRIHAFSGHTYGNGFDDDSRNPWPWGDSPFREVINSVEASPYKGKPLWITEYGDLDQTGEIEFEFTWRSARRLVRLLNDGITAAQAWDAFDNFHEHDAEWAVYGLLKTDTINWTYEPKKRYFGAKQVYRFVKPGYFRIGMEKDIPDPDNVYAVWKDPFKNLEMAAFASENGKELTIVGLNLVEGIVRLTVDLSGFQELPEGTKVYLNQTDRDRDFAREMTTSVRDSRFTVDLSERSIFSITTIE